mmetsp:Transcript_25566/g.55358  ORF Transcript_25566/g.55358 Transcript_25566/m.55358 type:complete len:205 (-) Transcript_25566:468-1082(-)
MRCVISFPRQIDQSSFHVSQAPQRLLQAHRLVDGVSDEPCSASEDKDGVERIALTGQERGHILSRAHCMEHSGHRRSNGTVHVEDERRPFRRCDGLHLESKVETTQRSLWNEAASGGDQPGDTWIRVVKRMDSVANAWDVLARSLPLVDEGRGRGAVLRPSHSKRQRRTVNGPTKPRADGQKARGDRGGERDPRSGCDRCVVCA